MRTSQRGLSLIKSFEGPHQDAFDIDSVENSFPGDGVLLHFAPKNTQG